MKIISPHRTRESMLNFGGPGSGKTTDYFHIAKKIDGRLYVIDTDRTVDIFLESDEYAELEPRVEKVEPFEWPDYIDFTKKAVKNATKDDWFIVDMVSEPWNAVQEHFAERIYGQDLGEYWTGYLEKLSASDGKGSKSPFDGQTDWQAINKMYKQFQRLILAFPGHVYLASGEKKINDHLDGADVTRLYKDANGHKPEGQKHLGHIVRTVMRSNGQRITTVKDRQRELVRGVKINDFALDYLVAVAGWKVEM